MEDYVKRPANEFVSDVGGIPQFVFLQAVAGPDEDPYPEEADSPTVYYGRYLANVTFEKTVGNTALDYVTTDRYDHFYNLHTASYIEENAVVCCLRMNGRLWTWDKVRQTMIVVCHDLGETAEGTGTLSMLSATDGAVTWTTDFGTIDATYYWAARSCDIDSRGNIYVLCQPAKWQTNYGYVDDNTSLPAGKVVKVSRSGAILTSYELPQRHASFGMPSHAILDFQTRGGRVAVDPNDNDRIYVGADFDENEKWLHRFDASLAVTWSIGPQWTDTGTTYVNSGRCTALRVSPQGKVVASNSARSSWTGSAWTAAGTLSSRRLWQFDADGVAEQYHDSEAASGRHCADACFYDTNTPAHVRTATSFVVGASGGDVDRPGAAYTDDLADADAATMDWYPEFGNWNDIAEAAHGVGKWQNMSSVNGGSGVIFDGGNIVWSTFSRISWLPTAGGSHAYGLFSAARLDGAGQWIVDGLPQTFGLATLDTGIYLAGSGVTSSLVTSVRRCATSDGSTVWTANLFASNPDSRIRFAVAVAARKA